MGEKRFFCVFALACVRAWLLCVITTSEAAVELLLHECWYLQNPQHHHRRLLVHSTVGASDYDIVKCWKCMRISHKNKREKERNVTGGSSPASLHGGTRTLLHCTGHFSALKWCARSRGWSKRDEARRNFLTSRRHCVKYPSGQTTLGLTTVPILNITAII